MPELPEVETTVRGLRKILLGHSIVAVAVRTKQLRFAFPRGFSGKLQNARILGVERRAKYILISLSTGQSLLVHLGMSGRMQQTSAAQKPARHDHVVLTLSNGTTVTYNDPRRFGVMDLVATGREDEHKLLRTIGPEPLGKDLNVDYLTEKLRGKKTAIKVALLDQRIIAGLGNIYVSEALYWAGIHPARAAGDLKKKEIEALIPAIQKVLKASIKAGGTSMRDYVQADGALGFFQNQFAVYDRAGQPCPDRACRGLIKQMVQGGRSTYFCPRKQR